MDDWRRTRTQLPASYDYLAHKRAIVGTPDQCVAKIQELQQYGIAYFGCNFDFGGMEHQKVLHSMELFAREVMPRLRDTGDNSISDNQQR
jgi:alkanesulfonate monooxygenase SsuD/methylene tetrahydromethanopterin reductase-like flavin-dependent oxidoreductase (luciferase family)